ncbi:MAG TPA: hypothetical protein VN426_04905 [Syntrophomonadaceae bacterium]|nr:hypothetical protein [Syntrophomonadaceae bacterium]
MSGPAIMYGDILRQVNVLENQKRDLSRDILLYRETPRRLKMIHAFLSYDLDKHELFEHAAVCALSNEEDHVLNDLQEFYAHVRGRDIMEQIRSEIKCTRRFMQLVEKGLENESRLNFTERRLLQEVCKYILEQARLYCRP